MNIILENPTILGISTNYQFSPGGIGIRKVKNISLEGFLLSLNNQSGVNEIWDQIKTYNSNSFDGFITITINGFSYANAKINSFNFNQNSNQDVLAKPFSIDFEVYEEMDDSSDKDYLESYDLMDVKEISDNFSLNINERNAKEYNHSFSVSYFNKTGSQLLTSSRNLLEGILDDNKYTLSVLGGDYEDPSYRRYYNETFDVFKGTYSIDEKFTLLANIQGETTVSSGISVTLGNGGIVSIREEVEIQGLQDNKYEKALAKFENLNAGAFQRCKNFLNSIKDLFEEKDLTPITGADVPTSRSFIGDKFLGKINYSVEFTNEKKIEVNFIKNFNIIYNRTVEGFFEINENGEYIGYGKTDQKKPKENEKFDSIFEEYSSKYMQLYQAKTVSSSKQIVDYALGLFTPSPSEKIYPVNAKANFMITDGKINFSHNYSNRPIYQEQTFGFINAIYSEEDALASIQKYEVPGFGPAGGKELIQFLNHTTPLKQSVSVEMKGEKNRNLKTYINKFKNYLPKLIAPDFMLSKNYSFDPINNSFQGTAEWILFDKRIRQRNNFTINPIKINST